MEISIAATHGEKYVRAKAHILLDLAEREAIEKEKSFVYAPVLLKGDGSL